MAATACAKLWALALPVAVSLSASSARAYEDEASLDLALGYAAVPAGDLPEHGALGLLGGSLGLDDLFTVRGGVSYAFHPDDFHVAAAFGELVYLVDVVQFVPFFGLGLDALGTHHAGATGVEFGAHAVLGADYLIDREWAVGLDLRAFILPMQIDPDRIDPVYLTAALRVSRLFAL